jgi:hypothetical protein
MLTTTSNFLTQVGRLKMVNSMLLALPTFYRGKIKLSPIVIKQIDKYNNHRVWRGADMNARKPPLAAWKPATRPKNEGWLGILNLETQNDALLLKNIHKFFNRVIFHESISSGTITTEMESSLTIGPRDHSDGEGY